MDRTVFIEKLKNMFIDVNKQDKRYAKVWLSEPEFAQFIPSIRYVLNVKTKNKINDTYPELDYIFDMLKNKLKLKKNYFLTNIGVYSNDEPIPESSADIVLLDDRVS